MSSNFAARARQHSWFARPVSAAEALIAQRTVKLAPEPPGERSGVVTPDGQHLAMDSEQERAGGAPLRFEAIGDSTVAGCGVDDQTLGVVPTVGAIVAARLDRDVVWSTHAKLGATMRRVRYRFLPLVEHCDMMLISAGSNDVMARRNVDDWTEDFTAVLDGALAACPNVAACSAGPMSQTPSLLPTLRFRLGQVLDAQTEISQQLCDERGIGFVDVAHSDLVDGYWASDRFHPGPIGYAQVSRQISDAMVQLLDR